MLDYEIVLYILGGLDPEYESVVVNLTSKDSITLPEAQFMLQGHELSLENFHSASALDLIATIVQISLNHNNFHNTNQSSLHSVSPRGSFCSSQGHNWQGMTSFHGKGSRNSNLRLHCQICGSLRTLDSKVLSSI